MQYCPKCSSPLAPKADGGRERPACPACGYVYFGQFSIGVGGVVVRNGKVLLIQRGQEPYKGNWQLPGGYAEQDESIEEAVAREVYEETGVRARPVNVVGFRHSMGGSGANIYVIFRLEPEEGEPRGDGAEVADTGYFSLEEIATKEGVQNLTKWALKAALSPDDGFRRLDEPLLTRPGYALFGVAASGRE